MFGFGGLRAVSLFVHRSAMFVETVFIPNVDLKTSSTNIVDLLTKKLTALSPPQYPNIFCVTIITLLTCNLFLLNSLNLIVTLYVKEEKHISLKKFKPLNLMVLIRKMMLNTSLVSLFY